MVTYHNTNSSETPISFILDVKMNKINTKAKKVENDKTEEVRLIYIIVVYVKTFNFIIKYNHITSMKRRLVKISSIMFLLTMIRQSEDTFDVKSVMESTQIIIGASHATRLISETTLINGHQAIPRLIILFKILKFMHGIIDWYWNGIRGQTFQRLKKLEKVDMEPFFVLNTK